MAILRQDILLLMFFLQPTGQKVWSPHSRTCKDTFCIWRKKNVGCTFIGCAIKVTNQNVYFVWLWKKKKSSWNSWGTKGTNDNLTQRLIIFKVEPNSLLLLGMCHAPHQQRPVQQRYMHSIGFSLTQSLVTGMSIKTLYMIRSQWRQQTIFHARSHLNQLTMKMKTSVSQQADIVLRFNRWQTGVFRKSWAGFWCGIGKCFRGQTEIIAESRRKAAPLRREKGDTF